MTLFSRWTARLTAWQQPALNVDALPAGLVLGGVILASPIGRGTTATVYAGTDTASAAARAVKVWRPCAGSVEQLQAARAGFLREAGRTQLLDHPGIVRVHGSGTQHGLSYIVSELFAGGSLARYTVPRHLLPERLVLDIAARLAEALAHAHRHGIVHRDVKPSNVLFDVATRRAALSDFGIARAPDAQASRSGVLLGSPVYMAPELLAGRSASAASDCYALAVLTYELLAGRAPFAAPSMGALLRAVAQAPPPSLAAQRPQWPPAVAARLDRWFETILAKDPALRPADGLAWAALARAVAADAAPWLDSAANATNPL